MAADHRSHEMLLLLLSFLLIFSSSSPQTKTVAQQLSSHMDRGALFSLRSSLGFRSRDWPRKADPCTQWVGVQCNGAGQVVGLNISGLRRTRIGRMNPRFSADALINLTLLSSFNASNFALPGPIPSWFPRLSSLKFVDLHSSSLNGTIPPSLFRDNLTLLDLSRNNLTGSLPLSISSSVAQLNLSHNLLYGALSSQLGASLVRSLSSSLDLSYNYLQGSLPPALASSPSPNNTSSTPQTFAFNCLRQVPNQRSLSECASFYQARGLTFVGFGPPNTTSPAPSLSSSPPPGRKSKDRRLRIILGAALGGGLGLIVLLLLLCLLLKCCRGRTDGGDARRRDTMDSPSLHNNNAVVAKGGGSAVSPPGQAFSINLSKLGEAFSYEQLVLATKDFGDSNLIKHGHSGDLYPGTLEGGIPVVVKRIDLRVVKREGYMAELDLFGRASHPRLVPLLGHCLEHENEKLLIYKYMPNRDLSHSLYRKAGQAEDGLQSLDWITRLKIAIGAAEALSYLHHECTPPLVHRDVQASSILLDDKFEVRLGSLSEVCTQEGDTHQGVISRLLRISQTSEQGTSGSSSSTCAYDVYCFGKVLLELVTGKLGMSGSNDTSVLLEWALPCINIYEKELVTKIVDPSLIVDDDLLEEVWAMAIVAKSCLNPKPSKRPLMRYILKALENPLKVVREDSGSNNNGNGGASARLRTTSSRGSWNAALFGSWRHSSSEIAVAPREVAKQSGTAGSQGSGGGQGGGDTPSHKRLSKEIFPEPPPSSSAAAQEIEGGGGGPNHQED
ncbi:hypothetical protein AMTRI_Chr13g92920 [Amborella trichopoda]